MGTIQRISLSAVRLDSFLEAVESVKRAGLTYYWVEYDYKTDCFIFSLYHPKWKEAVVPWIDTSHVAYR